MKVRSRRRRAIVAMVVLGVVLVPTLIVLSITAGSQPSAILSSAAEPNGPSLPKSLRSHPRVVIAEAPGSMPVSPDSSAGVQDVSYPGGNPDPPNFNPPSDATIKRELKQLKIAGLGGGSGSYVNPFAHVQNLVPERIDMGVDYSGTGPVVALGSGRVFNTNGGGWPGGVFIGITLDSGPYAGKPYYIAECVKPTVQVGQHVQAGQMIATMYDCGSGIETGWASGTADEALAASLHQQAAGDPGGWSSAAGISFDRLLVAAGAPSGIPQGGGSHGQMPPGYP
jgi:hypothetical protein